MATAPKSKTADAPEADETKPVKLEKLYVQSVVGRMVDCFTNKEVHEPAYHENTLWLKSQIEAGKVVLADPDA